MFLITAAHVQEAHRLWRLKGCFWTLPPPGDRSLLQSFQPCRPWKTSIKPRPMYLVEHLHCFGTCLITILRPAHPEH